QMQKRRESITQSLTGGIASLFKANKVDWVKGTGTLQGKGKVKVTPEKGKASTLQGEHIVVASGSVPVELKAIPFDGKKILDSTGALELDKVPKKLGVIGAGYIGIEMGSVWSRLGSEVTVLEALDEFMPLADRQIAKEALKRFKKEGLDIRFGTKVKSAAAKKNGVHVELAEG